MSLTYAASFAHSSLRRWFNLYYRALKRTQFKWLDLITLSQDLLGPGYQMEMIRYFTAPITGKREPASPIRQQRYLQALESIPGLSIHRGSFLATVKLRQLETPLADGTTHVRVRHMEEKGSDVNLGAYLIHDAWAQRFDAALVYSQDTDLLEPLRLVREDLGKVVGVVVLDGRKPGKLPRSGSFQHHLTPARLTAAQFPSRVYFGRKGKFVDRPPGWAKAHPPTDTLAPERKKR